MNITVISFLIFSLQTLQNDIEVYEVKVDAVRTLGTEVAKNVNLTDKELVEEQIKYVAFHSKIYALTHYQTTNFRLFQIEKVCRRQFQIRRKWQTVIQMNRKHCWKRRNCSLRAISPFPTVFSKGLFPRGIKRCHCVGMG